MTANGRVHLLLSPKLSLAVEFKRKRRRRKRTRAKSGSVILNQLSRTMLLVPPLEHLPLPSPHLRRREPRPEKSRITPSCLFRTPFRPLRVIPVGSPRRRILSVLFITPTCLILCFPHHLLSGISPRNLTFVKYSVNWEKEILPFVTRFTATKDMASRLNI